MREFSLFHEIDLSLPFPSLESSLYDDCESPFLLAYNIINDTPLTNMEEVFDPPLMTLSFVAPSFSSTPMDTSISYSNLLASPLPLDPCTGLAMGENSRGDVSVLEDASLVLSKVSVLVEPCLEEAPFQELCGDIMMDSTTPSI